MNWLPQDIIIYHQHIRELYTILIEYISKFHLKIMIILYIKYI